VVDNMRRQRERARQYILDGAATPKDLSVAMFAREGMADGLKVDTGRSLSGQDEMIGEVEKIRSSSGKIAKSNLPFLLRIYERHVRGIVRGQRRRVTTPMSHVEWRGGKSGNCLRACPGHARGSCQTNHRFDIVHDAYVLSLLGIHHIALIFYHPRILLFTIYQRDHSSLSSPLHCHSIHLHISLV
jgi:hypothetical protein